MAVPLRPYPPPHSGPESPKMDKTIYSLNIYILYMFIGFFWVKESVFEVFRTLGAVMTPQVVIKWWSQVVIGGQDKVKAMRYVYL